MNAARYCIALLVVALMPGGILFWFSIHPFVGFWRKVGVRRTLAIHYGFILLLAVGVVLLRTPLMAVEFGADWRLAAVGAALLIVSGALKQRLGRHLSCRMMTGVPELKPDRPDNRLLTEGVYSRIRHPRYVQLWSGIAGWALVTNYLAVYGLWALVTVLIPLLVRIEEKELHARFGPAYEEYCSRVPRFIPRF